MRVTIMTLGFISTAIILVTVGVVLFVLSEASTVTAGSVSATTSQILKTEVSVADVPVSLKSGNTQVIGLRVENPPGFSKTTAIHLPSARVTTDASKSGPNRIFINKLTITRPEIRLEVRDSQANLTRLLQAVNAAGGNDHDDTLGITFSVREILIENGEVVLAVDNLGDEPINTPLPDSRLTNLGMTEDGISADQLVRQIVANITKSTERASRRINLAKIAEERGLPKPDLDLKTLLTE